MVERKRRIPGLKQLGLSHCIFCTDLFYADNANNYDNYSGTDSAIKQGYLEQRNKYGWWIGFVYIYGLLDAIVEAHLHPFKEVMNEDLEQPKKEGNQEK